jgi:hypothetical protein
MAACNISTPTLVVPMLIAAGADVNARCFKASTALITAARNACPATVQALLEAGADVNAVAKNGNFPLRTAIDDGSLEKVELLLDAGANLEGPSIACIAPLSSASLLWASKHSIFLASTRCSSGLHRRGNRCPCAGSARGAHVGCDALARCRRCHPTCSSQRGEFDAAGHPV